MSVKESISQNLAQAIINRATADEQIIQLRAALQAIEALEKERADAADRPDLQPLERD